MLTILILIFILIFFSWIFFHILAFPSFSFARWGEKTFGSYSSFLDAIFFIHIFLLFFIGLLIIILENV
jgi:hypothetical protein